MSSPAPADATTAPPVPTAETRLSHGRESPFRTLGVGGTIASVLASARIVDAVLVDQDHVTIRKPGQREQSEIARLM